MSFQTRLLVAYTLILFAFNMSSCASKVNHFEKATAINRVMDSWVGHHQSELIASWGPPTKVESDEKGGNIIIYESLKGTWGDEHDKHLTGGAHYATEPRQPGYAARRAFYVNGEGIVQSWKWSGL